MGGGEALGFRNLTLDGLLRLALGRVSRVNDRFFHRKPPFVVLKTTLHNVDNYVEKLYTKVINNVDNFYIKRKQNNYQPQENT